jgi:hypothetical protein
MLRRLFCLLAALLVTAELSAQTGQVTVLVMPANSVNKTEEPFTLAELTAAWAPSAQLSQFFVGLSSGKITAFVPTVRPYVTYPGTIDYSACTATAPRDYSILENFASSSAAAAGVSVNAFNRQSYMMPSFGCGAIANGGGSILRVFGRITPAVWAHEILHTYGLGHPFTESCGNNACVIQNCQACNELDHYNIMGDGFWWEYPGMFERMNISLSTGVQWLDPARVPIVRTSGVATLRNVESPTGQIGVQIEGPPDVYGNADTIGVEVRRDGVVIRKAFRQGTYYRTPTIFDMDRITPGSQQILPAGQSYTWNGVTLTVEAVTPGVSASVRVTFPGGGATPTPDPLTNPRAN